MGGGRRRRSPANFMISMDFHIHCTLASARTHSGRNCQNIDFFFFFSPLSLLQPLVFSCSFHTARTSHGAAIDIKKQTNCAKRLHSSVRSPHSMKAASPHHHKSPEKTHVRFWPLKKQTKKTMRGRAPMGSFQGSNNVPHTPIVAL